MNNLIFIGQSPDYRFGSSNLIDDFYYHPSEPNDWIHTLQEGRLFPVGYGHICLNDHKALQTVIEAVGKIKTDKIISISVQDNNHWCDCPKCKAELPSETLIRFVNGVAKRFPEKKFSTLAYYRTENPPNTEVAPNVEVIITTIEIPKSEPYETSKREDVVEWRRRLKKWLKLTPNVSVWDYYSNFRHLLMPYPVLLSIFPNIKWFKSLGIENFIFQCNFGIGHEFSELKAKMIDLALHCPVLTVSWVLRQSLIELYGIHNSEYVRKYIVALHNYQKRGKWCICYADPIEFRDSFLTDQALSEYTQLLNRKGLEEVYLQVLYAKIELGIASKEEVGRFREICEKLGDITVNENNLSWRDYLKPKQF